MIGTDDWRKVHAFWFPAGLDIADHHEVMRMLAWWMAGGATPELGPFRPVVEAARSGLLDPWRATPHGRLSLIVVLDQFPRGLFAGTPDAFRSDPVALAIAEEGMRNGHYEAVSGPFEKDFFMLPLVHTEGPGHQQRLEWVVRQYRTRFATAQGPLKQMLTIALEKTEAYLDAISRFGRFPHRNAIIGRPSTAEELAYLSRPATKG